MTPMEARARKRRGRRVLLLVTVLVVGGSALLGRALRTSEDVHRGHRLVLRAGAGRHVGSAGRREHQGRRQGQGRGLGRLGLRSGPPAAQPAGPAASAVHRGLGRRARLAGGVPAGRRRQGRLHRDVQGQRRLVQSDDRQAPLDAQGRPPRSRRAPRSTTAASTSPRSAASCSRCAARDGKRVWRYRVGARTESSPLLVDGTLYFGAEDGTLTALDARNGHRRWRVQRRRPDQGLARLQRRPARRRLLRRPRLRLQRPHGHAALAHRGPRHATAGSGRAASTPRRRSRTAASTSARPTAACTRSWPRPARSRGASRPAATSTPGPRPCTRLILFGSYDHKFYALNARTGAQRWRFDAQRAHLGLGDRSSTTSSTSRRSATARSAST